MHWTQRLPIGRPSSVLDVITHFTTEMQIENFLESITCRFYYHNYWICHCF